MSKNETYFAPQLTPGTHSQLGGLVGVVGGRQQRMVNVHLRVHDGTQTQGCNYHEASEAITSSLKSVIMIMNKIRD